MLNRALIEKIYPELPHRVSVTQCHIQRFPHEPDHAHLFETADNIQFAKNEDFRYMRAAADNTCIVKPLPARRARSAAAPPG